MKPAWRLDAGPAWGTLIHGLLEHAGRHKDATRDDLLRLARWMTVETTELRPVVPAAVDLVEGIVRQSFWADLRAGGDVQVEVPFAVRIPPGHSFGDVGPVEVPTVLRGVIDLVYLAADGWRILDYKTDVGSGAGGTLLERHGSQIAHYREAWEHVTGEPVAGYGLVSVRTGAVDW